MRSLMEKQNRTMRAITFGLRWLHFGKFQIRSYQKTGSYLHPSRKSGLPRPWLSDDDFSDLARAVTILVRGQRKTLAKVR